MNRRSARLGIVFTIFIVMASAWLGCGGSGARPTVVASGQPTVEGVWRSKCGSCHVPIDPGTRPREVVEAAVTRHRSRLALSNDQWHALVDFLAPKASSSR